MHALETRPAERKGKAEWSSVTFPAWRKARVGSQRRKKRGVDLEERVCCFPLLPLIHHCPHNTHSIGVHLTQPGTGTQHFVTMATAQATASTRTHLTLKGSTALVHEFFNYSVQSILYQRSIYPSDDFKTVKKYGLQMLVTTDDGLIEYLDSAMAQLKVWLERGDVTRLVVVIVEKDSGETRERWQFDVDVINQPLPTQDTAGVKKTDAQVRAEIAAIIKQITASCTFLPVLDEPCAFQILAYTNKDAQAPAEWIDSDARLIAEGQAEQVRLRSFSTHVHRVDAMVAYRRDEDDE